MPFTPFHLGPGLLFKAAAPARLSFAAYAVTQVVIDVESGYFLITGGYPVHRSLHTFALGAIVGSVAGAATGWAGRKLGGRRRAEWPRAIQAECEPKAALAGGVLGGTMHSLLDGLMHADIAPFRPFSDTNPLRGVVGLSTLHAACSLAGLAGILWLALRKR